MCVEAQHLMHKWMKVPVAPYGVSVVEFTNWISALRDKLGKKGMKYEGLIALRSLGAEGRIEGNVLVGDKYSLTYGRSPEEVLRIVYGDGDEHRPGGFYPLGADGRIAKSYISFN
ncbi:hypothetical protein K1719_006030 [Acacia pycnantha]|nr:hypothetical protein K1719_006030 [Acacia pycnantha]